MGVNLSTLLYVVPHCGVKGLISCRPAVLELHLLLILQFHYSSSEITFFTTLLGDFGYMRLFLQAKYIRIERPMLIMHVYMLPTSTIYYN